MIPFSPFTIFYDLWDIPKNRRLSQELYRQSTREEEELLPLKATTARTSLLLERLATRGGTYPVKTGEGSITLRWNGGETGPSDAEQNIDHPTFVKEEEPLSIQPSVVPEPKFDGHSRADALGDAKEPSPDEFAMESLGIPDTPSSESPASEEATRNTSALVTATEENTIAAPSPVPAPPLDPLDAPFVGRLSENLIKLAEWLERAQTDERITPERALETSRRMVSQLMTHIELEPINENGIFDERTHRIVECLATDREDLHMQVAETFTVGYRRGERILQPQEVVVYKYAPIASTETNAENEPTGIESSQA